MTGVFSRLPRTAWHIFPVVQPLNLRWIKRHGPRLLGWPGMAGICLLSACLTFYFSTILPLQEKLASTRNSVIVLQQQAQQTGRGMNAGQRTSEAQLDEFYRMFPDERNMPEYLDKIFSAAEKQGISLDKGDYKVTRGKEGNLVNFQMNFPVKGEYPQIRKYLAELMEDISVLSLQQVQFKRQKADNPVVEADIRLVLYLLEQKS